jgi:hypothetical protein
MAQVDIFTFIHTTIAIFFVFFLYYSIIIVYLVLPLVNGIKSRYIRFKLLLLLLVN